MQPRTQLVLVAIAFLALAGMVGATLARVAADDDGPAAEVTEVQGFQGPRSPFKGALRPPSSPRDFALHDQDGKLVELRALRGLVVVLSPMYTTCEDTCPLIAQQIRAALDDLSDRERGAVRALALSVDPANDTPEKAKRFLFERRVGDHLDFLLGSPAELRRVWRAYGFSPQTEQIEHNAYVVLIDVRGRQRVSFPVDYLTPESLAHDLRLLVRERSDRRRADRHVPRALPSPLVS